LLDLRGVELIDPGALAVLLSARRRAQRLGIALKLVCDVPHTLKVLSLTGLDRSFEIFATRESALETHEGFATAGGCLS
jgi:anti-anti-sigma factor